MKVTGLFLLKSNGPEAEPFILGHATDLNSFGYFQRGPVREMLNFASRTVCKRTQQGQRQSVAHEEYLIHVYNRGGLVGLAVVDQEYPARAAFCIINKLMDDFSAKVGDAWKGTQVDSTEADEMLQAAIVKYQVRIVRPNGGQGGVELGLEGDCLLIFEGASPWCTGPRVGGQANADPEGLG
jgi:synaptobrevin family protein YKT6